MCLFFPIDNLTQLSLKILSESIDEKNSFFKKLKNTLPNSISVYSHEETGNWVSYQRDIQFKRWCKNQDINWYEYQQHGVQRPIFDRDGWSYEWNKFMNLPKIEVSKNIKFLFI